MVIEALTASLLVASASLIGVLIFGRKTNSERIERIIVPLAVGVFMSLVLVELIPETFEASPSYGAFAIMFGFISFYALSNILHKKFHHLEADECDKKGVASLILIGDAIHNLADGFILGGAFLINPTVGVATAIGLALHEIPQEIVEFGVLLRAGYTKKKAATLNFISATSIIAGTLIIIFVAHHASDYVWLLSGFAAGNLLFLAASDLLPRIHGQLKAVGGMNRALLLIIVGFITMSAVVTYAHERFGHEHAEDEMHQE